MDLTASSAVNLAIINASLRLVVISMEVRSIRRTYSGARATPRGTLITNLMFLMEFLSFRRKQEDIICLPFLTVAGLRGFGVNLSVQDLLAVDIHLDLLRLGFSLLGEFDLQYSLFIVGAYLPRIYRTRKLEC